MFVRETTRMTAARESISTTQYFIAQGSPRCADINGTGSTTAPIDTTIQAARRHQTALKPYASATTTATAMYTPRLIFVATMAPVSAPSEAIRKTGLAR